MALPPISWASLASDAESDAWEQDRKRKVQHIARESTQILEVFEQLKSLKSLRFCTPEIVRTVPNAASWFVALAGYSQKSLRSCQTTAEKFGLKTRPETFLKRARSNPKSVTSVESESFCKWVNSVIGFHIPEELASPWDYAVRVGMIAGARVVGVNQNEGGDLAVDLLKQFLLVRFGPAELWRIRDSGQLAALTPELIDASSIFQHVPSGTIFDFSKRIGYPDITISRNDKTLLVGEIKGRKDLSNTWESWMPQVVDHMITWGMSYPTAYRGVFMTLVTEEMIEGRSRMGVSRVGLKELCRKGLLSYAVNLTSATTKSTLQYDYLGSLLERCFS